MRIEFDPQDIEILAQRVVECLKPLLADNRSNSPPQDELLSMEEAAIFLRTSKAQIYQWVNNSQHGLGDFPFLKAGRLLRFSKSALLQWLAGC
jgi:excisionase family DNA binding protein